MLLKNVAKPLPIIIVVYPQKLLPCPRRGVETVEKTTWQQIIVIIFFISLCIFLVSFNLLKPRVLILHSYATDYSWVNDVNKGIDQVIGKKPFSVKYFYLDTKRRPDTGYMTNAGIAAVPPREIIQWTEQNSKLPGISHREVYVEDGVMMAVGASPLEQGQVAAEMVLAIIEKGQKPKDIFFRENRLYIMHIREAAVKAHHIAMPKTFEAFARATGHYY